MPVRIAEYADYPRPWRRCGAMAVTDGMTRDCEEAPTRDRVRAVPAIIVEGGRRLTGVVDLPTYRKTFEDG